jgi:SM-20-related protein
MNSADSLFHSLEEQGWATSDQLFPNELIERLAAEAETLWSADQFHAARIGRGSQTALHNDIRGDSICWLNQQSQPPEDFPGIDSFFQFAESFRCSLNERYFLGLNSAEFHFARYPAGQGYARHLDQHAGTRARKISFILYLNSAWQEKDGGQLVIETAERNIHILPSFGRVVLFRSDLIPHEVLPCFQTRWSLTGWFRTEVQSHA